MNPEPIPTEIAEIIQEYSWSLKSSKIPKPIMIIPKSLLSIDNYNLYIKVSLSICHGKKDTAFDMLDSIRVAKSVEQ